MKLGLIAFMQEMFEHSKDNEETKSKVDLKTLYSVNYMSMEKLKHVHVYGWGDPIKTVLKGIAREQYKRITEQFFEECYEGIMNRAPFTSMVRLIRNYQLTCDTIGAVKPVILCTKDIQKKYCEKYIQKVPILMAEERGKVDLTDYGTIVVPYLEIVPQFGIHVNFTNIYCLNYRENFEDTDITVPVIKYSLVYSDTNQFGFYEAYPGLKQPVG